MAVPGSPAGGVRPTINMAATITSNPTGASAGQGLEGPGENVAVGRMNTSSVMGEGFARSHLVSRLTRPKRKVRNLRSLWFRLGVVPLGADFRVAGLTEKGAPVAGRPPF